MAEVLVLGVGGVLGEAWMSGFLAGAQQESGADFRGADTFVGTSAGAIVAAGLAAGGVPRRPQMPGRADARRPARGRPLAVALQRAARVPLDATHLAAAPAMNAAARGGARARAALAARLPAGTQSLAELRRRVGALGSHFDGRLRLVAVERASGRRVVFGTPGAPAVTVADAVAASCAVPGLFRPVLIDGREYVDGGAWSPTNLDVANVGRGDRVLCLVPTAATGGSPWLALVGLAAGWRLTTGLEVTEARRRGATVTVVGPDAAAASAMGSNPMDPRPADLVLAEGFRQGAAAFAGDVYDPATRARR